MLIFFILFNSVFTPNFFRIGNLNNIITQICPTILCGMGMTLVISTGGIDIAVGSVMALAGVMTAQFMPGTGLFPALILAVLASVFAGCISGFFVGRLKLQAMVITLGMQLAAFPRCSAAGAISTLISWGRSGSSSPCGAPIKSAA